MVSPPLIIKPMPNVHFPHLIRVIGTSGRGPKWMVVEYGKLDARYWPTKDPLVMLISYVELAIMGPLCILWYVVIFHNLVPRVLVTLVKRWSGQQGPLGENDLP